MTSPPLPLSLSLSSNLRDLAALCGWEEGYVSQFWQWVAAAVSVTFQSWITTLELSHANLHFTLRSPQFMRGCICIYSFRSTVHRFLPSTHLLLTWPVLCARPLYNHLVLVRTSRSSCTSRCLVLTTRCLRLQAFLESLTVWSSIEPVINCLLLLYYACWAPLWIVYNP